MRRDRLNRTLALIGLMKCQIHGIWRWWAWLCRAVANRLGRLQWLTNGANTCSTAMPCISFCEIGGAVVIDVNDEKAVHDFHRHGRRIPSPRASVCLTTRVRGGLVVAPIGQLNLHANNGTTAGSLCCFPRPSAWRRSTCGRGHACKASFPSGCEVRRSSSTELPRGLHWWN